MKKMEYWVHFDFQNGVAQQIRVFKDKAEAEAFAKENDGVVYAWKPLKPLW